MHQGVELKENIRLFKNLFTSSDIFCEQDGINWTTAYMWNDFRFQDDGTFGDNDLPGVLMCSGALRLLLRAAPGLLLDVAQ